MKSHFNDWQKSLQMPIISYPTSPVSLNDLNHLLTEVVSRAAEDSLRLNNGEICLTLSGGLDSSFCLAKLREVVGYKTRINTFTIAWSEDYPDIQYARKMAEIFGTFHAELIPTQSEIAEAQTELFSLERREAESLGNVAVFMAYQKLAELGQHCVIAHDGIDELLGGYWEHRRYKNQSRKVQAFTDLWARLEPEHIKPLFWKAQKFSINLILPYLNPDLASFLTRIPLDERTSFTVSKIPLRTLAEKYLPKEILERKKLGFCSALGEN